MDSYRNYKSSVNNSGLNSPAPQEDDDIESLKTQIRSVKQNSLAATRVAVSKLAESEEVASSTLERLGRQSDRINSADRHLELADAQADKALEQSKELKRINNSMFSVFRVKNPFKSKSDPNKIDKLKAAHQEQLEREEQLCAEREQAKLRSELSSQSSITPSTNSKVPLGGPNSRYNFEEDEEGLHIEKEIDTNLDSISSALGRLKNMSLTMTDEIDSQNSRLDKINLNSTNVEAKVAAGRD
ncbi:Protein transport protein S9 plasma membrane t-SNARE, partial [Massospora cicadina]